MFLRWIFTCQQLLHFFHEKQDLKELLEDNFQSLFDGSLHLERSLIRDDKHYQHYAEPHKLDPVSKRIVKR